MVRVSYWRHHCKNYFNHLKYWKFHGYPIWCFLLLASSCPLHFESDKMGLNFCFNSLDVRHFLPKSPNGQVTTLRRSFITVIPCIPQRTTNCYIIDTIQGRKTENCSQGNVFKTRKFAIKRILMFRVCIMVQFVLPSEKARPMKSISKAEEKITSWYTCSWSRFPDMH